VEEEKVEILGAVQSPVVGHRDPAGAPADGREVGQHGSVVAMDGAVVERGTQIVVEGGKSVSACGLLAAAASQRTTAEVDALDVDGAALDELHGVATEIRIAVLVKDGSAIDGRGCDEARLDARHFVDDGMLRSRCCEAVEGV
jgi:hypothetical protein